jgi:hypothetical protein
MTAATAAAPGAAVRTKHKEQQQDEEKNKKDEEDDAPPPRRSPSPPRVRIAPVVNKALILKYAKICGLTLLHDRELAWTIGEWKAHNHHYDDAAPRSSSNNDAALIVVNQKNINWDDILDLVCFELQKRIVNQRWRPSFNHNWLKFLVSGKRKRRIFVHLKNEAERYCLSKLKLRYNHEKKHLGAKKVNAARNGARSAAPAGVTNRWGGLSQAGFDFIFPPCQRRRQQQEASTDEPALLGEEEAASSNTRKRRRSQQDEDVHDDDSSSSNSEDEGDQLLVSRNATAYDEFSMLKYRSLMSSCGVSLDSEEEEGQHEAELTVFVNRVNYGDHVVRITSSTTPIVAGSRKVAPPEAAAHCTNMQHQSPQSAMPLKKI